jgi:hypothetical protein
MTSRLLERIEVNEEELAALATARAAAVRDGLLATGKVEGDRVFIASAVEADGTQVDAADPRVEFSLN